MNFMKYSSILSAHHQAALDILNDAHHTVTEVLKNMGVSEDSQVNFEVPEDQSKPLTKIRKRLLRSGFGPVFNSEFVFESTSYTKKILSVEEMKTLVEIGVMERDEVRTRVL
jgi:hypothetical protein